MNQKKQPGLANPSGFKAELKIKPLPASVEEYAKQYFINLMLQGYTLVSPDGSMMTKNNIEEALGAWK